MKTIKITAHAIVNISGHGEKFQGDVVTNVSDVLADQLIDAGVCVLVETAETTEPKPPRKSNKKPADSNEGVDNDG